MYLDDGTGNGYKTKVDRTNRANVRSVSDEGRIEAAIDGNFYIVSSGSVTLTDATQSAVLIFQNNESFSLALDRIVWSCGPSTGATGTAFSSQTTFRPTSMTDGSGTELTASNVNSGSNNSLDVTGSEKGAQDAVLVGGGSANELYYPIERTSELSARSIIASGGSIGFSITPPAGNTSMDVAISLNLYKVFE